MTTTRIWLSLPLDISLALRAFAELNDVTSGYVIGRAITAMANQIPEKIEIREPETGKQYSISDTCSTLLNLWSKQTGISRSRLVTWALQKTIIDQNKLP